MSAVQSSCFLMYRFLIPHGFMSFNLEQSTLEGSTVPSMIGRGAGALISSYGCRVLPSLKRTWVRAVARAVRPPAVPFFWGMLTTTVPCAQSSASLL